MHKSRIPSPARSQGVISTPRRHKSRGSRSVCSPAPSNASGRLTSVIDQYNKLDSFVLSPMTTRRSVLTDNTDIEEPRRKSWWKNLNENSQDIMEVLDDNKAVPDSNDVVEDIVDIEVLSQENKHISLDLPESSDNESIHSIVLSQRKLFTQKENKQQKKFGQLVGTRETLAKLHKTNNTLHEKTVTVTKKELFQGTKRSKPVFPLLNISPNKTTADKTKENVATEPKVPVRNIFGNRPANKRKNIFADFIVSESEDEIPEIQVKVFGFQKKVEQRRISSVSKARDPSPTSSITTDMELDEWKLLPSSTLVENQLDEMITHTPVKRARLSKISDVKESEVGSTTNTDKTMQSNKSSSSKSRTSPRLKDLSITKNTSLNKTKQSDKSASAITRTSPRTKNKNEIEIQEEKNKSNHENINESISSKSRTSLRTKDANRSKRQEDNADDQNILKENKADVTFVENEPNKSKNLQVDNQKPRDPKDNLEDKSTIEDEAQVDAANRINQSNKFPLSKTRTSPRLKDSSTTNNTSGNKTKQSDKSVSAITGTRTSPRNKTTNENEIQKDITRHKLANETDNKDRLSVYQDLPNENVDVNEDQQNQSDAAQELEGEQSKDVNEDEEEDIQANESQETEAEKTDEENEDHTASLIYDDSESEGEETNKTVEDNESNVSQEDNNESNKNQQETSKQANVSKKIENTDNKRQETSDDGNKKDNEVNTSKANVSQKVDESQEMEHDSEDQEIGEVVGGKNEGNDEANVSHKVNESQEMEHESDEGKNDEAVGDNNEENDEANVTHKVDESQDMEHESDEDENDETVIDNNDGNDEANVSHKVDESQEVEHESDEDEKANESEEVENTDNKSQDITDNDNEDNEANVDESQEVQDESEEEENDDNEMNDSANESQEIEQSNNESEQLENDDDNDVAGNTSEQEEMEVDEIESNDVHSEEVIDESPNITHDTTGRNRKKIKSPEVILHDKTNLQNSFTAKGRNTSVRKSKSMYQALNIRPSLVPPRDSLGLSERDSSAEGSGWDSHRTTRKTLRQTFGKDFTPRKSLRALVMEKSAKRHTEHMETLHSETVKFPQANSTEYPEDSNRGEDIQIESDHEVSRNTRLTTLEAYLEKIKQKNQENKFKMDEAIRNSLKAPSSQDVLNLFKVPTRPPPKKLKPASNKPKKPTKYMELFGELPPEVIEDMKYKPPKRYQPPNASWVTKRLYKFLESKLEPNYDYKARVRAEKLVETIYAFSKEVLRHRHAVAPPDAVDVLKHELARLNVVKTHFEFYEFFHEFMPRELRIKVVPDVVNKIPLPRHGVFADIIRGNTVQG